MKHDQHTCPRCGHRFSRHEENARTREVRRIIEEGEQELRVEVERLRRLHQPDHEDLNIIYVGPYSAPYRGEEE